MIEEIKEKSAHRIGKIDGISVLYLNLTYFEVDKINKYILKKFKITVIF